MVSSERLWGVLFLAVGLLLAGGAVLVLRVARYWRARRTAPWSDLERGAASRVRRWAANATLVVALGVLLVGVRALWEPTHPEVTQTVVLSPKLPAPLTLRVVQLSDLHSDASSAWQGELPARVAGLRPDVILFTGDAINEPEGLAGFRSTMSALARIAPTYAVRGNWEVWWFPEVDLYGGTGVVALDGRSVPVVTRGQRWWLVGIAVDDEQSLRALSAQLPRDELKVLLHHFPALAPRASSLGFDLMLAGDTHGGQMRLPWLGEIGRAHV